MASAERVAEWIARQQEKDLLRLLTCGSVDDGKSTLIGRLLHDAQLVHEDQLEALERDSRRTGGLGEGELDFALLTDGLKAEREQGITIDVAYRYFSTERRKFIIADAPGHEQYTRNMVTGASTAGLAVILIDARSGVTTQTRRHGFIASLLGIPHVVVAVNKMDLVGHERAAFEAIRREYADFAGRLDFSDLHFIPVSALNGDNVVHRSERMSWYQGSPLLDHLETVHLASDRNLIDLRLPVQCVIRHGRGSRGYAGTVASGVLRVGDEVTALPSARRSRVAGILRPSGECAAASAGEAVTVTLEDEIDVGRGDVLTHPGNLAPCRREFEAMVVWMSEEPLRAGDRYLVRQGALTVPGVVAELRYAIDVETLRRVEADELALNEIARVRISCTRPIVADAYSRNRSMGCFLLIDRMSNATVAAGMVRDVRATASPTVAPAMRAAAPRVQPDERRRLLGQAPATVWLTGLPKSGKSTIAVALERLLVDQGHAAHVLDGSTVRRRLSSDLAFGAEDRKEQVRRLAEVARVCNDAGLITIVAAVSPYEIDRAAAREAVGTDRFLLVHCDAPLEVCESRDHEGVYARARAGGLPDFSGISAPYEEPLRPDLVIHTDELDADAAAKLLRDELEGRGVLRAR